MTDTHPRRRLRYPKPCRLRHKSLVDALFDKGESVYAYPMRAVWLNVTEESFDTAFHKGFEPKVARVQMLVSIPKRKLHHAVDRVLMRRRIREAYRQLLPDFERRVAERWQGHTFSLALIYIATRTEPYGLISRKLAKMLDKITEQ